MLINADVNLMHVFLQYCYFKVPLFHYKTLLVHDFSNAGLFRVSILQNVFVLSRVQNVF